MAGCGDGRQFANAGGAAGTSGSRAAGGSAGSAIGGTSSSGGEGPEQPQGGEGGAATEGCTPGDSQSCYESPEGVAYAGKPPTGQMTCRLGARKCADDGSWGICVGAVAPLDADTCDAGNDSNCNGTPNEGCDCKEGDTRACGTDVGNCVQGQQTCKGNAWGECVGEVKAAASDSCEKDDDANCNGMPHDSCACYNGETKSCGTDVGPCEFGTSTCVNGVWPAACTGGVAPSAADTCEAGNDANCNNTPNEGCKCKSSDMPECGSDVGACKKGKQSCTNGTLSTCMGGVNPTTNDTCLARDAANDTNCNGNTGDGCECVLSDGPKQGCGDSGCGQQLCDGASGKLKTCSNINSANRCNPSNLNQRQVCGPNGVFIAQECNGNQWCAGNGTCKLRDGEVCVAATDCATGVCSQFYTDADGDLYRASNTVANFCGTAKAGYVLKSLAKAAADCAKGDNNEFVFPGAEEVCDGVDNDCNGKIDRDDKPTMVLGNGSMTNVLASGSGPRLAWSGSIYGIGYGNSASGNVRFAGVNETNDIKFKDKDVNPFSYRGLGVAWNGTSFGVFSGSAQYGDPAVNFYKVTNAGIVSAGSPATFGPAPDLNPLESISAAAMGNQGWYIVGNSSNYGWHGYGYVLNATKAGTETMGLPSNTLNFEVAVSGTTYGVVYKQFFDTASTIQYSPRDKDGLALKPAVTLATSASSNPAIVAKPTGGFGVAWYLDNGSVQQLYVEEIGTDGAVTCGPIFKTLSGYSPPTDIVATKRGFLIPMITGTGLELEEVLTGCKFANPYLAIDTSTASGAQIAAGAASYLLTWENSGTVYTKALGPDVCN
jgi:hypothetical protein